MTTLVLVIETPIVPELRAEAVELALWMQTETLKEPGCRRYQFAADLRDANRFVLVEEWESAEALQAHVETPHMATFRERLPRFVAGERRALRFEVSSAGPL